MVKIRLKRQGAKNRAFYRIVVADARAKRDGKTIEDIGYWDPLVPDESKEKALKIDADRFNYWISKGAQPTNTVRKLAAKLGLIIKSKR